MARFNFFFFLQADFHNTRHCTRTRQNNLNDRSTQHNDTVARSNGQSDKTNNLSVHPYAQTKLPKKTPPQGHRRQTAHDSRTDPETTTSPRNGVCHKQQKQNLNKQALKDIHRHDSSTRQEEVLPIGVRCLLRSAGQTLLKTPLTSLCQLRVGNCCWEHVPHCGKPKARSTKYIGVGSSAGSAQELRDLAVVARPCS